MEHRRRAEPFADAAAVLALLALIGWYAGRRLDFSQHPEEDAAILLRYAQHVGQGHGIVWNVGERPLDGATDFIYMLVVGALTRAGAGLETAAKAVGVAAHVLAVLLVYASARRWARAAPALALVPAAYLALGPGLRYVSASYGTTVFTLMVAAGWWAACALFAARPEETRRRAFVLGLSGVAMGIARPEGAFLAVFFLGAALIARRADGLRQALGGFLLGYVTFGLAWVVWRWGYFGHLLPNPFYRRGGGHLYPNALLRSARNVLRLGGPFLLVLAAGVASRPARRLALAVLAPVVAFTALWVLLSDEGNYYMRYAYPILPVVLVGAAQVAAAIVGSPFAAPLRHRLTPAAAAAIGLASCAALAVLDDYAFRRIEPRSIGLYDVALRLAPFRAKGYTLASTEAGLLPLYSGWNAVDTWGLNDAWIARHGSVTSEYLDRYRPEVLMFHADFSPDTLGSGGRMGPAWGEMVRTLQSYAEDRGYELAAVFARNRRDSHYYYVRPGFLDHDAVVAAIREGEYDWDGQPTMDLTPATQAR